MQPDYDDIEDDYGTNHRPAVIVSDEKKSKKNDSKKYGEFIVANFGGKKIIVS